MQQQADAVAGGHAGRTPAIELRGVSRRFGTVVALDEVSLTIAPGEFFALLGPSGSGKTTCLRLIAGFDHPDDGVVLLGGADVTALPPHRRTVNTVFQDYALFPHMSVAENVGYGLMVRGIDRGERERRSRAMLQLVQLEALATRRPAQLSGGQKQRVALARALVNEPKVLLLDEPLGALDLKLREQMQAELKALQRRLGVTFVFVTHDQGEALSMADRVAVFDAGRIEQLDTPRTLYTRPRTPFVARFVGSANVFEGATAVRVAGAPASFAIRPELIELLPAGSEPTGRDHLDGVLEETLYHGSSSRSLVRVDEDTVVAVVSSEPRNEPAPSPGTVVRLAWWREHAVPLDAPASP